MPDCLCYLPSRRISYPYETSDLHPASPIGERNVLKRLEAGLHAVLPGVGRRWEVAKAGLKRTLNGRHVKAVLVETEQGLFACAPEDWAVGGELAHRGRYGRQEIDRILSLTNASSRVLFVGSHIGSLVIPVAGRVAHVTAIEANPATFELLRMNIGLNDRSNVEALQIAAADNEGAIDFVLSTSNTGGSKRMPLVKRSMYFQDNPVVVQVKTARLDDLLPGDYDLIVMDIEGSEYFALQGMPRLLARARHLISEFRPHHFRDVAGVTAAEFVELVAPHFDTLYIPTRNETLPRARFQLVLGEMFDRDQVDDGVVFSKA
jgi:FkbM family methyltransferase